MFFYDNYTQDDICGIFSAWHFIVIAGFFLVSFFAIYFSQKLSQKQTKTVLLVIAIAVTVMEIVKIVLRLCKGANGNSWIPLYFCSLFIYAIWLSFSKNQHIKNTGYSFMVFGGIFAAISFIIYPSTSLMLYPLWHPSSLHSILYHGLMFYSGIMVILKKLYVPKAKDFFLYLIFTTIASLVAIIINHFLGTNMMFLGNPFGLPILSDILNYSKILYILLAYIAQCVILFWLNYGIYKLFSIRRKHNNGNI